MKWLRASVTTHYLLAQWDHEATEEPEGSMSYQWQEVRVAWWRLLVSLVGVK